MRDLELWRRLTGGAATPADLAALAELTPAPRAPYFALIAPLCAHEDPAMRAAAVRALGGARGVPGLRLVVAALDDEDVAVRAAAAAALAVTARAAPMRAVHGLFHPRDDVRRASLERELDRPTSELVAYLHADPACADLAATGPWPARPLPLAFDLFAQGAIGAGALVTLCARTPVAEVRAFLDAERGRASESIEPYLEAAARAPTTPPGRDVLDLWVRALDAEGGDKAIAHFVETVTPRRPRTLARRAVVSLLGHARSAPLVGAAVALEPRVLGFASFDPAHAEVAAHALVTLRWPNRPNAGQVERLLRLPVVRRDLALAVAVAGLLPGKRLAKLADLLGEEAIVRTLLADGRGFRFACMLPAETPAVELTWLARIEAVSPARYVELAAIALGALAPARLEAFIEQVLRKHRPPAFVAFARSAPDADQLNAVCAAMAKRVDRTGAAAILTDAPPAIAIAFLRAMPDKLLAQAARAIDDATALAIVANLGDALPFDREVALAHAFAEREALRPWVAKISAAADVKPSTPLPETRAGRALSAPEQHWIGHCGESDLETALRPALLAPTTGLTDALAIRPAAPSVAACTALMGCADPLVEVARELDRFAGSAAKFDDTLDHAVITMWQGAKGLPPLADARLWRWEAHQRALGNWMRSVGGAEGALRLISTFGGRLAGATLWRGIAELLVLLRYRDTTRFNAETNEALAKYVAEQIDTPIGRHAARILVMIVEMRRAPVEAWRARVLDRVADADAETREQLGRILTLQGLPAPRPVAAGPAPTDTLLAEIRACDDLDRLADWCADPRDPVVQEAVLRLLLHGERGQLRLAALLGHASPPILASLPLWDSAAALDAARVAMPTLPAPARLHVAVRVGDLARAFDAAHEDGTWFRREEWELVAGAAGDDAAAIALADAPHFHAYNPAVAHLIASTDPAVVDALRRFLEVGSDRPLHLRRAAARALAHGWSELDGLPIVLAQLCDDAETELATCLPASAHPAAAELLAGAALIGGHDACAEKRFVQLLDKLGTPAPPWLAPLFGRVLEEATMTPTRAWASRHAVGGLIGSLRMQRVAEVFAWGVRRGVELTGRLFRVHMTAKERDLGHTYLDQSRVYVSPLPMLRGEPYGEDVVEGLILHELGHHMFHRGEEADALWKKARTEGLGPLLNLVADEHLERNLRGVDPAFGDRLKRLGAYAFHHSPQEIAVVVLLGSLRGAAFRGLSGTPLDVAFDEASVRIRRGAVLGELDRAGHPLARFTRALRLGLGNRHADPLVAQALALCKDIRRLDMKGLYELTHALADLFGGATSVAQVFGGAEGMSDGDREREVWGAGVSDDGVQREVDRILDPGKSRSGGKLGPHDRLAINVNPDERFNQITRVVRIDGKPEDHRRLSHDVARHSTRLRAFLDDLGLRWEPARARLSGRALDRTRLRPLVTRNDPRILVARTPVRRTDLFLGTIIDCSGSMQAADNIERARRFAVLIAEAVRPLRGVEARFFGFTDTVIYDCGDAGDCGVTGLRADGGNNDAAALYHVAQLAAASAKRARVLVMISDGLPTECSVGALKGLVRTLTRRKGMVCAQVAVRPLAEVCFPHYVVLDDAEPDVAVARFGRMIGDLARKGLT